MSTAWHTSNRRDCSRLPYGFLSGDHPSTQMREATLATRPCLLFSPVSLTAIVWPVYQGPVYTGRFHWIKFPPTVFEALTVPIRQVIATNSPRESGQLLAGVIFSKAVMRIERDIDKERTKLESNVPNLPSDSHQRMWAVDNDQKD